MREPPVRRKQVILTDRRVPSRFFAAQYRRKRL